MDITIILENNVRTILRFLRKWLPPRVHGVIYSFTFLLGGLFLVLRRAVSELYKFLTGQIPHSQLSWPLESNARSHVRLSETVAKCLQEVQ